MPNIHIQANANEAQYQNNVSSQLTEIASRGTQLTRSLLLVHRDRLYTKSSGSAVEDITTAVQDCGHRQLDLLQVDYEHLFTHGHEFSEISSCLVLAALHGEQLQV